MPLSRIDHHMDRSRIEELCCLYVLGDLSQQERALFEEHVQSCQECRSLTHDFERITLFELPTASILRSMHTLPEMPAPVDEDRLLAAVRERAGTIREKQSAGSQVDGAAVEPCRASFRQRLARRRRLIVPVAGWALAATLLLLLFHSQFSGSHPGQLQVASGSPQRPLPSDIAEMEGRFQTIQDERNSLAKKLAIEEAQAHENQIAIARMTDRLQELDGDRAALETELLQKRTELAQRSSELQLARDSLTEEIAGKDALQARLADAYSRLEKQSAEVNRLERIAATVPARYPVAEPSIGDGDAKEILGARDLHIVDVYDVDHSGKPSQAYGRVYYIDHKALILYAFDLSKLEKNHKAVAFQAWGFRQPQSSGAQSLGLFYLDNATLNRWTLRVSDPQILERIDTLYVTVEPPGGSPFPKGRRLLMASLAGPPNHP